jgi:hypothetical protein
VKLPAADSIPDHMRLHARLDAVVPGDFNAETLSNSRAGIRSRVQGASRRGLLALRWPYLARTWPYLQGGGWPFPCAFHCAYMCLGEPKHLANAHFWLHSWGLGVSFQSVGSGFEPPVTHCQTCCAAKGFAFPARARRLAILTVARDALRADFR